MNKRIEVRAAETQHAVLSGQCDVVSLHDTVKEARARAKYMLTDSYQASAEASEPLRYAQVVVDGVCVEDYFRKKKA